MNDHGFICCLGKNKLLGQNLALKGALSLFFDPIVVKPDLTNRDGLRMYDQVLYSLESTF
jgi:hypothetical protein